MYWGKKEKHSDYVHSEQEYWIFFFLLNHLWMIHASVHIKYWAAKLSFRSLLFMHMWLGGLVVSHSSSRVIAIFTQMDNVGIKDFEYRVIKCAFIIIVWSHFSPICLKFSLSALYSLTFRNRKPTNSSTAYVPLYPLFNPAIHYKEIYSHVHTLIFLLHDKLLIYWHFNSQPSPDFTANDPKRETAVMRTNMMWEFRAEPAGWFSNPIIHYNQRQQISISGGSRDASNL